jgi:proline iminopeptidase
MVNLREGYVSLDNGNIYYKIIGEGKPIVFIHGGPGLTHDYFISYFNDLVNHGYQLIFYDQRGNGKSKSFEIDNKYININEFTLDIETLKNELGLDKIILLGHSMGGFFAINYSRNFLENVEKIVLLNSIPIDIDNIIKMNQNIITAMDSYKSEVEESINNLKFKEHDEDSLKNYLTTINQSSFYNKNLTFKLFENAIITEDFMKRFEKINSLILNEYITLLEDYNIKEINIPVLLINSEYDFIPIESSNFISSYINDCEVKKVEKCGHYSFIENTKDVIDIILEWI